MNYFSCFILLCFIAYHQNKYLSIHVSRKRLMKSRQKQKLVLATVVFSIGILYRGVMNLLKPILGDDSEHYNIIENLET